MIFESIFKRIINEDITSLALGTNTELYSDLGQPTSDVYAPGDARMPTIMGGMTRRNRIESIFLDGKKKRRKKRKKKLLESRIPNTKIDLFSSEEWESVKDIDGGIIYKITMFPIHKISKERSIVYMNAHGDMHRLGGPARITIKTDGNVNRVFFFINGNHIEKTEFAKIRAKIESQNSNPTDAHLYDL